MAFSTASGCIVSDSVKIIEECDYIFIAVKPDSIENLLLPLKNTIEKRCKDICLVTMAAGTSINTIEKYAHIQVPIIRIMPNVACFVGKGMILATYNSYVTAECINTFTEIMEKSGTIDIIGEKYIDSYSIVSGCGPAYVYTFIEALADAQVSIGVPRDKAYRYAAQTVFGSAAYMLESGEIPASLKDRVCSPGGTTIQGIKALEKGAFRFSVMDAVSSSYEKTLNIKSE